MTSHNLKDSKVREMSEHEYTVINNYHGWAKNSNKEKAVRNSLNASCNHRDGDIIKCRVYRTLGDIRVTMYGELYASEDIDSLEIQKWKVTYDGHVPSYELIDVEEM